MIFVAISLPEHQKTHVQTYVGWKINSLNKIFNSCEGLKAYMICKMWGKGSDKYVSINKDWEERRHSELRWQKEPGRFRVPKEEVYEQLQHRGAVSNAQISINRLEVAQNPGMRSLNSVGGHYLPGQHDKLGAMEVSGYLAVDPGTGTGPARV